MVANPLGIPALHRQGLERGIVDHAAPAAPVADEHPVGGALVLGEAQLAELPQARGRLQHPEAALGGLPHPADP